MKQRVLIVEDDIEFANLICEFLESEDFKTHFTNKWREAFDVIKNYNPDMILMDRNLNGMDGMDIIKEIRANNNEVPVIFITSLIQEPKVIEGLKLSNCDYLKKPFGLNELKLRIERHFQFSESELLFCSKNFYLPQQFVLKRGDQFIPLSKYENTLLMHLFENQGKTCTLESIIYTVWGDKNIESLNRVDVLVKRLRNKLKGFPYIITNHKGVGYTLNKT